jgi:2,4-diketo-3-deoxy-L-fuconate hydrolase
VSAPPADPAHDVDPATGLRSGTFGIGTFTAGARAFPALVLPGGEVVDVSTHYPHTLAVFEDLAAALPALERLAAPRHAAHDYADLRPLPPITRPNLLCAGANSRTHVAQMLTANRFNQHNREPGESDEGFYARNLAAADERGRTGMPFLWSGLASSLIGAHDEVVLPVLSEQPDWELELGVVLSGGARFTSPDRAGALIAGYTVVNDLGTVDMFRRADIPWGYDWIGKHQPTFKPAGPFVVPAPFVDVHDLRITLRVDGRTMQDWPADDWIFSPEQMLTYASERVRLLPGDLLLMGSPPGNGAHHGRFLQPGDVIDAEITGLGRQRNRCVAEDIAGREPHFGRWRAE